MEIPDVITNYCVLLMFFFLLNNVNTLDTNRL